jgi:hypothetical protein
MRLRARIAVIESLLFASQRHSSALGPGTELQDVPGHLTNPERGSAGLHRRSRSKFNIIDQQVARGRRRQEPNSPPASVYQLAKLREAPRCRSPEHDLVSELYHVIRGSPGPWCSARSWSAREAAAADPIRNPCGCLKWSGAETAASVSERTCTLQPQARRRRHHPAGIRFGTQDKGSPGHSVHQDRHAPHRLPDLVAHTSPDKVTPGPRPRQTRSQYMADAAPRRP